MAVCISRIEGLVHVSWLVMGCAVLGLELYNSACKRRLWWFVTTGVVMCLIWFGYGWISSSVLGLIYREGQLISAHVHKRFDVGLRLLTPKEDFGNRNRDRK